MLRIKEIEKDVNMHNSSNDPLGDLLTKMQLLAYEEDRLAKIIAYLTITSVLIIYLFYCYFDVISKYF